jgi:hypothetical protein
VTARINFAGADQLTPDGTAVTEVNDFIRAGGGQRLQHRGGRP